MRVLLTNDDGIRAEGLRAMYRALREAGHTVHVVAPMHEQSGVGHSLTFFDPLRAHKIEEPDFEGLGLYGTPTDCVKLALGNLLKKRPDMVISGINAGSNVGPDILYSGTVGARHAVELAARIDWKKVAHRRVINVNYPRGPLSEAKGLRICPQTSAVWKNAYAERKDPRGEPYWWLEGEIPPHTMLNRGYITVTPLRFEFTDHESLRSLEDMLLS